MSELYPEIEPYEQGFLEVDHGNRVYWETCGNPHGKPAVVLHGGPGSGCTPWYRTLFDPSAYRLVLFDQRNCGRSTPHASALDTSLESNTTVSTLDEKGVLPNTPTGLLQRIAIILGWGWMALLALRLLREMHAPQTSAFCLYCPMNMGETDV